MNRYPDALEIKNSLDPMEFRFFQPKSMQTLPIPRRAGLIIEVIKRLVLFFSDGPSSVDSFSHVCIEYPESY